MDWLYNFPLWAQISAVGLISLAMLFLLSKILLSRPTPAPPAPAPVHSMPTNGTASAMLKAFQDMTQSNNTMNSLLGEYIRGQREANEQIHKQMKSAGRRLGRIEKNLAFAVDRQVSREDLAQAVGRPLSPRRRKRS